MKPTIVSIVLMMCAWTVFIISRVDLYHKNLNRWRGQCRCGFCHPID